MIVSWFDIYILDRIILIVIKCTRAINKKALPIDTYKFVASWKEIMITHS